MIKAIVLSYDKSHPFVHHMIKTYENKWTENPFIYRIPYNENNSLAKLNLNNVEFIKTDSKIKNTVLSLLEGIDDEEWIYWAIDDEYLIDINTKKYNAIANLINNNSKKLKNIDGICLVKYPGLDKRLKIKYFNKDFYYIRDNYSFIWLHQFVRAGIIRHLFNNMPSSIFAAKKMDYYLKSISLPPNANLLVSANTYSALGESTTRGYITLNCLRSFMDYNISIPKSFEVYEKKIERNFRIRKSFKRIIIGNVKTILTRSIQLLKQFIFSLIGRTILSKKISNTKCVFCINSGRVGSQSLAELLNRVMGVAAYHEPYPQINGMNVFYANEMALNKSKEKRWYKTEEIAKKIFFNYFRLKKVYVETSNMFIKTFYDVVLDYFKNIEIIVLRRDFIKTLRSFIELGYFTSLNSNWEDWMTSPNATSAAIKAINTDEEMDQIDLTIAYLIDIEARTERFIQQYPNIKIHYFHTEYLNDSKKVEELFNNLGFKTNKKIIESGKSVKNSKNIDKRKNPIHTDKYLKERVLNYFSIMSKKEIPIPDYFMQEFNL